MVWAWSQVSRSWTARREGDQDWCDIEYLACFHSPTIQQCSVARRCFMGFISTRIQCKFYKGHYNDLFYLQCTAKSTKSFERLWCLLALASSFWLYIVLVGLMRMVRMVALIRMMMSTWLSQGSISNDGASANAAETWSQCTNLARPSPAPPSDSELCPSSTFESSFSLWRWSLLPLEGRRSVSEDDSSDEDSSEDDSSNARGLW